MAIRKLFLNLIPLFFLLPSFFLLLTTYPAGNLYFIANLKPPTRTTYISSSLSFPAALASLWDYSGDEDPDAATPGGEWSLLQASLGVSAMHMQLLHDDTIVIFDRTSTNCAGVGSFLDLDNLDCSVHSVLYDVASNTFRPLTVQTDTFCSSGSVDPNGVLIQTGGYSSGERVIRTFYPCNRGSACDWKELPVLLSARRWYSSNHLLPDGRIIIVGGRNSPSYEFFPPNPPPSKIRLPFLLQTWDGRNNENNLYPFLHLFPDGNLFIFANNRSIAFDYRRNQVVREYPPMPGDDRRCYPSTGSSVLLPIMLNGDDNESPELEVLICGGAPAGAYYLADEAKLFVEASRTCGRLKITDSNPRWLMEKMPMPRVMGDMIMLPTGDVLIINGAGNGTAGWDNADNPVLHPVLYRAYEPDPSRRFAVMKPTAIPRMYHSSAVLVSDGRVLVAGSNPNPEYTFIGARFPTELRMESYAPHYLDPTYALLRPSILTVESQGSEVMYGQMFAVTYDLSEYRAEEEGGVAVTMLFPPFTTHSFGMNQRMVVPKVERIDQLSVRTYKATVRAPRNANVGPPGYYLLFLVHAGIPSRGVWLKLVAEGINDHFPS